MDYDTVTAPVFGASLRGIGVNLLVPEVAPEVAFLTDVLGMSAHRVSRDYAIMVYGDHIMQLHADPTYSRHALYSLLPENPPRGAGACLHVFDTDPDTAAERAPDLGGVVLAPPQNKMHGLRETVLLSPAGYSWAVSRPL